MVHLCNPKVNNSEDEKELMKCTNWWKTERVFFWCSFGLLRPMVHVCVPAFQTNLLPPSSGLSNLVLVGNIL